MIEILVVTEGATEREVGKVLHERGILSQRAEPKPPQWRSRLGQSREGYDQVIQTLTDQSIIASLGASSAMERLLLIFDQEDATTPEDRADRIGRDLSLTFIPKTGFHNLFECNEPSLRVLLHISSANVQGILRKDFDGYILQLLQGSNKQDIVSRLLGTWANRVSIDELLKKAEQEIPALMQRNGYPWTHAKSWLYAYITAFQFRQSHVWFAGEIIRHSPENDAKAVFQPLISAWEALI